MQNDENFKPVIENGIYAIYDTKLKHYELPIVLPVTTAVREIKQIVNSYGSKYFFAPDEFILYRLGSYDNTSARFDLLPDNKYINLGHLSDLIDETLRRRFMLLHTLSTLPTGYFKMPSEMKDNIQKNIDEACQTYVKEFIVPEIEAGNLEVNSNIQNPRPVGDETDTIKESEVL